MNLSCRPCCHASSSRASRIPPGAEPALFTRTSIRPKCRAAPRTKFSASSRRVRSAGIASTLRPDSRRISSAAASSTSLRRAQIATSTPSRASTRAMPLPMPRLPPVTSATLPLSCRSIGHLARDRVRYVGEPLALVVAEDRHAAEDAAERVSVDYEPLEAVVDPHDAAADRVLIHEASGTNIATRYRVSRGDPDAAFASAAYTRRETFRCQRHSGVPLETRGLVATWDATLEKLTVLGATKVTFFNRRALARMLRLDEASIELIEVDVGGSFGVRGEFYPEDLLIPLAAIKLGRPVTWFEDRRESFLATNHSRQIECELEIAARADGTVLGLRGRLLADMGAYVRTNGGVVPAKAAQFLPGPYRIPHFACEVQAVITNKTPVGTYRGPGRFEANFFRERLLDLMASDLGLDPADVRLRNLITPAELPWTIGTLVPYEASGAYDGGDYAAALRRALEASDYARLAKDNGRLVDGTLRGIGIGCFVESSGAGPAETARIVVLGPGRVELYSGCASSGQGHETVLAQILADELAIPFDWITVLHGSTSFVAEGWGTYHSRAVVVGGSAVAAAAAALKSQLVELAANVAGLAEAALE